MAFKMKGFTFPGITTKGNENRRDGRSKSSAFQKNGEAKSKRRTPERHNPDELKSKGLGQEEINSFMEFADKNPAEYGIDGAINMWRAVTQGSEAQGQNQANPLDSIRQNQQVPQQAGILNGQQPVQTNEDDNRWKGVLKASRVGNKIP